MKYQVFIKKEDRDPIRVNFKDLELATKFYRVLLLAVDDCDRIELQVVTVIESSGMEE